jgi:hypothetical protein
MMMRQVQHALTIASLLCQHAGWTARTVMCVGDPALSPQFCEWSHWAIVCINFEC